MNVLLVDDQKAVVESLKKGIYWERLKVSQVLTACSAKEAKLILRNFPVDILVTDIEMPEEDGLPLGRWAKIEFPLLECIFLTSHAEFEYAKEAIRMGGFDYILQPARYEDVEHSIAKAIARVEEHLKMENVMRNQKMVMKQRNALLEMAFLKLIQEKYEEADQMVVSARQMLEAEYRDAFFLPLLIQLERWNRITNVWEKKLVEMALCNVIEEIFAPQNGQAGISALIENRYWIVLIMEQVEQLEELIREKLELFFHFVNTNLDFKISIYPGEMQEKFHLTYLRLCKAAQQNREHKAFICWETSVEDADMGEKREDPIERAIAYVKRNLSKNISRTEVAREVYLNEEYFSRLFRQRTGATFKDYVLMEKMEEAKKLLRQSKFSVGIIASKVGYDNFSHFSKMFKKITDQTPQEYRKEHQK
ncbi:response regulator transcription factor [Parablautia muri]|uniref:Stage 0 sporulation protein A homolog n=1 Tax=Parablautia muri TaxID=2320879 RepID=A0A9X5BEN8_9FIRM|nr:helix-turn-helix domain-containing protein [Parablautia muri]NBJ92659.1 helix-turn-helix domain-containing protein [Parablautia muri]